MKRFLVSSLALLLIAGLSTPVFAQVEDAIKNRARGLRDANNARQGVAPSQPPPATPATPGAPVIPRGIDPAQQARIDKLEVDISGIKAGAKVGDDDKKKLQADMLDLVRGTNKPSGPLLTNLVNHLTAALTVKDVSLPDTGPAMLARDINIVVNSINLSPGLVSSIITAVQNLLRTAHVPEDNYKVVVTDLKAIAAELQKNKGK